MKILLIDNFDSFTFNLAQYFKEVQGVDLTVLRNDELKQQDLESADKLIISPGPGIPSESGNIIDIIQAYAPVKPILGVCLGMQAIYEAYGGALLNLKRVFHGVTSTVRIVDEHDTIFRGISNPFKAGRYHSWICDPAHLPPDLLITAWDEDGEPMACRHKTFPLHGVQFHPESFLTPEGKKMIRNFVEYCRLSGG